MYYTIKARQHQDIFRHFSPNIEELAYIIDMKKIFRGVCTALVTPFKKDKIDWKAFGRLIEFQIANGVDALLVLGTTGESPTISDEERKALVTFAMDVVAKRVPVIVGIGGNNPTTIIKYGTWAKEAGADMVMVTAPYYNKTTQEGAVKFFDTIAKNLRMPIMVYNIPGRVGMNMQPETLARIAKNKYIQAIKESSGNIEQIQAVVRLCPKTAVYTGDDTISLPCYAVGCIGIVSVASNSKPKEVGEIFSLFARNKIKKARDQYFLHLPFFTSLFTSVNPIPIKQELSRMGLCCNELRLPLVNQG